MPRRTQEQPDVPPLEYRTGVTMPALGGMYRRGDPSQIPRHRLHLGVNIRLANNDAGSRDGLAYEEGTQEDACITGIFEITDFAVGVYITQLADGGLDGAGDKITSTFQILAFNEEKDPVSVNYWDEDSTFPKAIPSPWRRDNTEEAFNTFQPFNDTLLVANGQDVYQVEFSEDDELPRMDLSQLFTLGDAIGNIVSTCTRRERVDDPQTGDAFEKDVLYMGCTDGEIWRYDGVTTELVHTLTNGGWMQIIEWKGIGLVAAGDNTGGFSYQEQPGFSWVDQAWGQDFWCNGLCEFLGEVVFVGHWDDVLAAGKYGGYAMRWGGTTGLGAPVVFASDVPATVNEEDVWYRTPLVVGGAVHWLGLYEENVQPPENGLKIARFTDFATGSTGWGDIGGRDAGFFIPYSGRMLMHHLSSGPAAQWPAGNNIVLIESGTSPNYDPVYNWPEDASSDYQLTGQGWEAIPI